MMCPYCHQSAEFLTSLAFYGKDYGTNLYICRPCDARVGTHGNSDKPLGTLANAELREWRKVAHQYFDRLWKDKWMTRTKAYTWLQRQMEMTKDEAHIGSFSIEECQRVIERVSNFTPGKQ